MQGLQIIIARWLSYQGEDLLSKWLHHCLVTSLRFYCFVMKFPYTIETGFLIKNRNFGSFHFLSKSFYFFGIVINRPGAAGAVVQSAL